MSKCKECIKAQVKARYRAEPEKMRAYEQERAHRPMRTMERIWKYMIERCHNPKNVSHPRYGARGTTVCDRWRNSLEAFIADVGFRPGREYSIDRIKSSLGYEPGNVRWATAKEQARNTRANRMIEYNGETRCLAEWAEVLGMSYRLIHGRLQKGWTFERAISEPKHNQPARKEAA